MTDIKQTLEEESPDASEQTQSPGAASSPEADAPGDAVRAGRFGDASEASVTRSGAEAFAEVDANGSPADEAADVEGDLDELVKTAKQRDEYLALAQRTQADFENFRKRMAKEAAASHERGVIALAKELLPALDNLDRALEAAAEDDPLLQGVRLVRSELMAALARVGIEAFSPGGEQFDPSVHEAVATAPAPAGQPSGTVIEVYQVGYRCRETVLRPARVVVAA
jgi:molecular chaperone GrpE